MRLAVLAAGVVALLANGPARAEPNCMVRVVLDAPAQEAREEVMSKGGSHFGPIAHVKVDRATGRMYYCGAQTYCYDSNALEFVTPCRIKLDKSVHNVAFFFYFTR